MQSSPTCIVSLTMQSSPLPPPQALGPSLVLDIPTFGSATVQVVLPLESSLVPMQSQHEQTLLALDTLPVAPFAASAPSLSRPFLRRAVMSSTSLALMPHLGHHVHAHDSEHEAFIFDLSATSTPPVSI